MWEVRPEVAGEEDSKQFEVEEVPPLDNLSHLRRSETRRKDLGPELLMSQTPRPPHDRLDLNEPPTLAEVFDRMNAVAK